MKNLSCHSEERGALFATTRNLLFSWFRDESFLSVASGPQISAAHNRQSSCRLRRKALDAALRQPLRGKQFFLREAMRAGNFQQTFPATRLRRPEATSGAETTKYRRLRIRLSADAQNSPRLPENTKAREILHRSRAA